MEGQWEGHGGVMEGSWRGHGGVMEGPWEGRGGVMGASEEGVMEGRATWRVPWCPPAPHRDPRHFPGAPGSRGMR